MSKTKGIFATALSTNKPAKTVASVLSSFKRTLDDLNEVADANDAEAVHQGEIAKAAVDAQRAASQEADKADRICKKLFELLEIE